MKISIQELKAKIIPLFIHLKPAEREVIADYLIYAEMCGGGIGTQGIAKLAGGSPIQDIIPTGEIKAQRETPVSALLDGAGNPGILIAQKAADIAIEKAKKAGVSIVTAHNFRSSNGAQSYYVEQIAKQDLIGIMCSRSSSTAVAFGSIDPIFGTNPVGYAFPTTSDPIVFDAATSAMTFYGCVIANARGEKLPEGIAFDKDGNPTTNPADVIEDGALAPFGNSYKASGFAMLAELLAGPLANGAFIDNKTYDKEWGAAIVAIDPKILVDMDKFKKDCSALVAAIRAARAKPGDMIRLPYDRARENYNASLASGTVEIDEVIYGKIFG
ncbi:MAG: Ldh family oxidoreductase [Alphaproteobacteria bacterium]|nr:Ldh family oxidoreductase [Alphaproteobacteria bacterium]